VHLGFFLARADQEKLCEFVRAAGTLIASGELPGFDERMDPCTVFGDFARTEPAGLLYSTGNVFDDERAFLGNLRRAGWKPGVSYSDGLRAFVYRAGDDRWVFSSSTSTATVVTTARDVAAGTWS